MKLRRIKITTLKEKRRKGRKKREITRRKINYPQKNIRESEKINIIKLLK